MKKIILPITLLAFVFTACKTEQKKEIETSRQLLLSPDTAGMYRNDASSDVAKSTGKYTAPTTNNAVATKTIIKHIYVPAEKPVATKAPVAVPAPVITAPPVVAATTPEVITPAPSTGTTSSETATTTAPAPVENKKKGISDAAKGAAIGGVGGAVAGAIIGKGGKGAIIGGVVGAAGGYILGRQKDKKTGRVDYATN